MGIFDNEAKLSGRTCILGEDGTGKTGTAVLGSYSKASGVWPFYTWSAPIKTLYCPGEYAGSGQVRWISPNGKIDVSGTYSISSGQQSNDDYDRRPTKSKTYTGGNNNYTVTCPEGYKLMVDYIGGGNMKYKFRCFPDN